MAGLLSLTKALKSGLGERKSQCAILELDDDDRPVGKEYLAFQYFPDSIQDTKAVHYQTKDIPGGSLPLYQWTSSGERVVSFKATFSADVDLLSDPQGFQKLKSKGYLNRNVDIRSAIIWLRRFMLPRYSSTEQTLGIPLTKAPRKLLLRINNSALGLAGGAAYNGGSEFDGLNEAGLAVDYLFAIMTQCDVTWEAFFPSGFPRLASVQLAFAQVAQYGGQVSFPEANGLLDGVVQSGIDGDALAAGSSSFFPYPIKVSFK